VTDLASPVTSTTPASPDATEVPSLADRLHASDLDDALALVRDEDPRLVAEALQQVAPGFARDILEGLPADTRQRVVASASHESRRSWAIGDQYPEDTVGRLMEAPIGVFGPEVTVAEAREVLRDLVTRAFITYAFVVNGDRRLEGVITMRDLLFAAPETTLDELMLRDPFYLSPTMPLMEAMRTVLNRHFPVYPVCDEGGRLLGLIRGQELFEAQAIELSAQAGSMVGVEKEERFSTPWPTSLKYRHPWLQLNLFTAFIAAAVVGIFEGTIDQVVVLAVFLPVLAGQSGNTGCQALAVTLRALTLGELDKGAAKGLVAKEGLLGLLNGGLVGLTAGLGMYVYATMQGRADAAMLSVVVLLAMTISCVVSGVAGALVPLGLKRLGADPATASSIFLTTATDVASMGLFLTLATLLVV
jgi:magnesium transporter